MNALVKLLISTLAILVTAYLLPGVAVDGFFTALVVAVVMAVINIFIRPILLLLTLPITVVTFGLFALILNALLIQLASAIVPDFHVENFWWALLFGVVLFFVHTVINSFAGPRAPDRTVHLR